MSTYSAPRSILWAGLICGVLDGLCAVGLTIFNGHQPLRMFQGIASGLIGANAFKGGVGTALLGVGLHFVVALGAAAVYFAVSRKAPFLIESAILSGVLFGIAVDLFMTFVVIPLSAIGRIPFVLHAFLVELVVHMIVVGPSIALTIRRFSK